MEVISYDWKLLPSKESIDATCYDIRAAEEVEVKPNEVKLIPTGIKANAWGKIYARSSLPYKKWLMLANWVGILDWDYRGQIFIQVYNFTKEVVKIDKYERIAQIEFNISVVYRLEDKELYDDWEEKNKTVRWAWWFGSTWSN